MLFAKHKYAHGFLTVLVAFYTLASCANAQSLSNKNEIKASNERVEASLMTRTLPKDHNCRNVEKWMWGTENLCPKNVIDELEIVYKKSNVYIPLSAYADISNVKSMKVVKINTGDRYSVLVKGGDAAFSYTLTLEFDGDTLLSRVVRHGEFSEESWEKTEYKFNL